MAAEMTLDMTREPLPTDWLVEAKHRRREAVNYSFS